MGWGDKFDGLFNQSGRAFPDVASQAFNLTFVERGVVGGFAGTRYAATFLPFLPLLHKVRAKHEQQWRITNLGRIHRPNQRSAYCPEQVPAGLPQSVALYHGSFGHDGYRRWRLEGLQWLESV